MRILDYGIAGIVETIFFLGIAALIGFGITEMINRKPKRPNIMYRVGGSGTRTTSASHIEQWTAIPPDITPSYRQPRFGWLEELRAKHHMNNLDRLARKIERKLERRQRVLQRDLDR